MKRRSFIKGTASAAATVACFPAALSGIERDLTSGRLERRSLGRTGEKLSVIGFGSFMLNGMTPEAAGRLVAEAIDAGVNYFDVAPTYGNAEERLGPALASFRQRVFLACKTTQRRRAEAAAELERSLGQLRTDHFDLYQLHAVTTDQDVATIFGPGGAIEAFTAARKAGKVRFLGFSAHSVEAALALMDRFEFDSILFPFNYATWHAGDFGPQVLSRAHQQQMGILALKSLAKQPWPKDAKRFAPNCWYEPFLDPAEALLALRFTLSHPVTAAVSPAYEPCFRLALRLASQFSPLTPTEAAALKERAAAVGLIFKHPRAEKA
ncbi:MAG TPA: aldo/keto reductase [Verrucomicrobiota bacterium]|nr:aldo/keto reductase [Verrucomicrobiota bacterium]HNU51845.1 aldo/keto reductase [Verrucomicrobiota bacterium]